MNQDGDKKMKKTIITLSIMSAVGSANAALVNGSTLNIGAGSFFTTGGVTTVSAPGFDGQFITGYQGLVLGTIQTPSGSHSGAPNGSESPTIDNPWLYFSLTGMHGTLSPSNVLSVSGNTATIDFSGWYWAFNNFEAPEDIPGTTQDLSSRAWFGTTANGVAQVTCGVDCGNGDTYTLIYSATMPNPNNMTFGDTQYLLNLTGTISAVPIPSAIWLFGSGLIALSGFSRRRKTS
jgi:hypothetical protein